MGDLKETDKFLKEQLDEAAQHVGNDLTYFKHLQSMLKNPKNSATELNKVLATVTSYKNDHGNTGIAGTLKALGELVVILKNAAKMQEEEEVRKSELKAKEKEWNLRKATANSVVSQGLDLDASPEQFEALFKRVERAKTELDYEEAKAIGFEGSYDDFAAHLA